MAQFDSTNLELALTREKTFTDSGNVDIGLGRYTLDGGTAENGTCILGVRRVFHGHGRGP